MWRFVVPVPRPGASRGSLAALARGGEPPYRWAVPPARDPMTVLDRMSGFANDLVAWRHDFHAHPESSSRRAAAIVAEKLGLLGVGGSSAASACDVVGVLEGKAATVGHMGSRDMDAGCPIEERLRFLRLRRRPARCTPTAPSTAHRRCSSAPRAYFGRTRASTAPRCSSSSRPRRGSAAPARCWPTAFQACPATRSTGSTTARRTGRAARSRCGPAPRWRQRIFDPHRGPGRDGAPGPVARTRRVIAMTLGQAMRTIVATPNLPLEGDRGLDHAGRRRQSAYGRVMRYGASRRHRCAPSTQQCAACRTLPHPRLAADARQAFGATIEVEISRYLQRSLRQPRQPGSAAASGGQALRPRQTTSRPGSRQIGNETSPMHAGSSRRLCLLARRHAGAGLHDPGIGFDGADSPLGAALLAHLRRRATAAKFSRLSKRARDGVPRRRARPERSRSMGARRVGRETRRVRLAGPGLDARRASARRARPRRGDSEGVRLDDDRGNRPEASKRARAARRGSGAARGLGRLRIQGGGAEPPRRAPALEARAQEAVGR